MAEYLDKGELISRIKKVYCTGCRNYSGSLCRACDIGDTLGVIDDTPTIELETLRSVAQWEGQYDGYSDGEPVYDVWECSNCGHTIDDGTDCKDDLPNYCPACGAKMEDDT